VSDGREDRLAIDAVAETLALKAVDRAGWVRRGVTRPESVAAHSWGIAWLVLLLLPEELDRERALAYAVVHDLAEARVGDLTPHDGVSKADKARLEAEALNAMSAHLPRGAAVRDLWHAYEAQADAEARFVRQLDRLDMAIQALVYAREGADGMGEFVESAGKVVEDERLREILDGVRRVIG